MWREIFNPRNYYWNPYAVPMFMVSILVFLEGLGIYHKDRRRLPNITCFLWFIFASIWLSGTGMVYAGKTETVSFLWYKYFCFFGVSFISISGYWFSTTLFRENLEGEIKKQKPWVFSGHILIAAFYLLNICNNAVVKGVKKYFWGNYALYNRGPGLLFIFCWCIFFLLTWRNFFLNYRKSEKGRHKKQLLFFTLAVFIGYTAAVDFIPVFGIEIYPFGYIPATIWLSLNAYAIIRYRAFEIDTVIHKTILWVITSLWLVLPAYVIFSNIHNWIKTLGPFGLTAAALVLFYMFLWYYHYFQPKIDHLFRRRRYEYYRVLGEIGEKIGTELDINKVIGRLFKELKGILYPRNILVLVQQLGKQDYTEAGNIGYERLDEPGKHRQEAVLLYENKLSRWLNEHKKALEREQVEMEPKYEPIREETLIWLKEHNLEVLIPVVMEERVSGLIGMGKKENLRMYTGKDIEILEKMGRQVGVTMDNALHHEDIIREGKAY